MPRPNTQWQPIRNKAENNRGLRDGAGEWRNEYFLVLYIDGVKTRVKVPVRRTDGLKDRVIKINMKRYFYQLDTKRTGR